MTLHRTPGKPLNLNVHAALRLCREWEDWVAAVIDPPTDGRVVPDLSEPVVMYSRPFSKPGTSNGRAA